MNRPPTFYGEEDFLNQDKFMNPWRDYPSHLMQTNLAGVLALAEYIWYKNQTYREAMLRTLNYFITKPKLDGLSEAERENYRKFLNNVLKINGVMNTVGEDYMAYSNAFTALYRPFNRYLICPQCSMSRPAARVKYKFEKFKFKGWCPQCHNEYVFKVRESRSFDQKRLKIWRISPKQMHLSYNSMSHDCRYLYMIPENDRSRIMQGDRVMVEHTPWEIIECIKHNRPFEFDPDMIFHWKDETLAGIPNNGWGIPRVLIHFNQLFYVQVLKKYNEALAMDYVMPIRVLTPAPRSAMEEDLLYNYAFNEVTTQLSQIIDDHRKDSGSWHTLGFPVEYQLLTGEGRQLAPVDLITYGMDDLLNSSGVPAEFYKGTLEVGALPPALRLFEQRWANLVASLNSWLEWCVEQIAWAQRWEPPEEAQLERVTVADDFEKKQIQLSLAQSNRLSLGTAMAPYGLDIKKEIDAYFEEQEYYLKKQREFSSKMQRADINAEAGIQGVAIDQAAQQQDLDAQQGMLSGSAPPGAGPAPPPGGMPPAGGGQPAPVGGVGTTMDEAYAQAQQEAQRLVSMPETARKSELINMKKTNPTLHAFVSQELENIRQEMKSQGYQMMQQQATGGGAI